MGTLDVLDLLFKPFPQFLPEIGIESLLVGERDTCQNSEILKRGVHHWRTKLEAGILILPFSSATAGAGPAYKWLIALYETLYPNKCATKKFELCARSVLMTPGCKGNGNNAFAAVLSSEFVQEDIAL